MEMRIPVSRYRTTLSSHHFDDKFVVRCPMQIARGAPIHKRINAIDTMAGLVEEMEDLKVSLPWNWCFACCWKSWGYHRTSPRNFWPHAARNTAAQHTSATGRWFLCCVTITAFDLMGPRNHPCLPRSAPIIISNTKIKAATYFYFHQSGWVGCIILRLYWTHHR